MLPLLNRRPNESRTSLNVRVDEVLGINSSLVADVSGQYDDYIVLANPTPRTI